MNAKQLEAIKKFKEAAGKAKRLFSIFSLGMITAFAIIGFFEAIEYQSIYEPRISWWIYIVVAIVAIVLAGKANER
jgi:hypothetical protein